MYTPERDPNPPSFYEKECKYCEGTGKEYYSCCGIDIRDTKDKSDLCPKCLNHCDTEGEKCLKCKGAGIEQPKNQCV